MSDAKTKMLIEVRDEGDSSKRMEVLGAVSAGEIVEVAVEGLPEERLTLEEANAGLTLRLVAPDAVPPAFGLDRQGPVVIAQTEPGSWTRDTDGRLVAPLNLATVQALALLPPFPPPAPAVPAVRRFPPPLPTPPPYELTAFGARMATALLEYRDSDTAQTLFGAAPMTLLPWPPDGRTADLLDLATGRVYSKAEVDALLAEKATVTALETVRTTANAANSAASAADGKAQTALDGLAGKADLVNGKVPSSQLPSYVDDVLEYASRSAFPATGETGKIYVALDTNKTYRWSGSEYVMVGGGDPPVPVAPSTDPSAAGKPADAKATGDALAEKAPTAHAHSSVTAGDTTLAAVNGGTATITRTGVGNASVTFPAGYSISYSAETYSTATGETIEFVGPYSVGGNTFWVPSDLPNPESFNPEQHSVWCLIRFGEGATSPQTLMFKTSLEYDVRNWDSSAPTLTLSNGEASGGAPTMTRATVTNAKTVATEDQIPSTSNPLSVANGGTGATTAAAARANLGAMSATADGNTILTGGTSWSGAPIGVFADQTTRSVLAKAPLTTLAVAYSESGSYEAGDVVFYTDAIYECKASTPSPAGSFDPRLWNPVDIASLLDEKQDTISDLATIRSGAAAGATAVQPSAMPSSETWTFVVDDGQGGTSTVTKQVAVYAAQTQGAGA